MHDSLCVLSHYFYMAEYVKIFTMYLGGLNPQMPKKPKSWCEGVSKLYS